MKPQSQIWGLTKNRPGKQKGMNQTLCRIFNKNRQVWELCFKCTSNKSKCRELIISQNWKGARGRREQKGFCEKTDLISCGCCFKAQFRQRTDQENRHFCLKGQLGHRKGMASSSCGLKAQLGKKQTRTADAVKLKQCCQRTDLESWIYCFKTQFRQRTDMWSGSCCFRAVGVVVCVVFCKE